MCLALLECPVFVPALLAFCLRCAAAELYSCSSVSVNVRCFVDGFRAISWKKNVLAVLSNKFEVCHQLKTFRSYCYAETPGIHPLVMYFNFMN